MCLRLLTFFVALLALSCGDKQGANAKQPSADAGLDASQSDSNVSSGDADNSSTTDALTPIECIDPASRPTTGLALGSACSAPEACDARVEGEWSVISACLDPREVMPQLFAVCNTAVVRVLEQNLGGSISLADGTITANVSASFDAQVTLPNSCTGCRCSDAEANLNAAGVGASCNPTCSGGNCFCDVFGGFNDSFTETYTANAGVVTTDSGRTFSMCVEGDFARFGETTDGASPARWGLVGDAGLPELCNGEDDDGDGEIDNDPRDCPTCSSLGVCSEGVVATCEDGRWVCTYTSAAWEAGEASCDTLDNDCDGQVDEADNCERCDGIDNDENGAIDDNIVDVVPCWAQGVCAEGGTPRCGGTAWWTCDYDSGSFEANETSCDGLDNDCDGVTDGHCCPAADAALFFSVWDGTPDLATVFRADHDGANLQTIAQSPDGIGHLDYVPGLDRLFWARKPVGVSTTTIERVSLDGTIVDPVATIDDWLDAMDISPDGRRFMYATGMGEEMRVADLDAPDDYQVIDIGPLGPSKAWVDWQGEWVYFQQPNQREISRIRLDGTRRELLVDDIEVWSIHTDHERGVFYAISGPIRSAPLAGGQMTALVDTPEMVGSARIIAWDSKSDMFFFGTSASVIADPVEVGRVSRDASLSEVFYTELGTSVTGLAVKACTN